ncbi:MULTISPECIES: hypothetical protein [Flavobacteriaceae]|jgi:hypothetical protein|uniref:Uncharacterized protein n=1 Tax=Nonlabens dokdonensis TaxID=328515 RepID=A0A1Z8ASP1_9FLAO|nr:MULTISPECIES: hypothetical protein [Flavobacteriaceae]MAM23259.1 hypothetical protein [Croceibacter sp.]MBW4971297.1 hypothetical protein [Croceibacter atlanticus]MCD9620391.1 hypothetical protein [Tenacibaculum maritimum]MCD9626686.1 hypothetical protein [Tenacibaculum maritimum]MCD9629083.1 hypothetical protein [Tenacibaculum maritimum]
MANKTKQLKYNQAIDDISYLILHYPLELQQLLRVYGITFRDRPSHKALINETVELMKDDNSAFAKALAELISRLAGREDEFWGAVAKGAVGILGGLFKKKKRRSSGGNTNAAAAAAAQAAAAKRDMERRMQQMREEQRRRDEERRQAEERRREEQKRKEAEAKKKTNMMLMIGGGVVVLGIGAAILMKSKQPPMPYGGQRAQMPQQL